MVLTLPTALPSATHLFLVMLQRHLAWASWQIRLQMLLMFLTSPFALQFAEAETESSISLKQEVQLLLLKIQTAIGYQQTPHRPTMANSFLQKSKVQCYGEIVPSWTHSNTFTPNLDAKHFTLLLNEAKAQAFIELKQQANPKAEKRARRGWIQAQRTKKSIGPDARYTAYGRK